MIYFDNAATTRPFEEVTGVVADASQSLWFNASATYAGGLEALHAIDRARRTVADALGVTAAELYFTSGGTESDNIAVFGGVKAKKGRVIASGTEHPAVHQCMLELAARGLDVQFVRTLPDGHLDEEQFASLLTPDTRFVSIMHVNNETGVVNDIARLAALTRKCAPDALFHSDGVQAFLKSETDLSNVDLYSVSAHKIHAGKGIGALYVRKGVHLHSPSMGGGQERGLRSGTENVPAILGFAEGVRLYRERRADLLRTASEIRGILLDAFERAGLDFRVNGTGKVQPNLLSVSFAGVKAEVLYQMLSDRGIFVSRGSACSTRVRLTRMAQALQLPKTYADGTMRFSFGYGNTTAEAEEVAAAVVGLVQKW